MGKVVSMTIRSGGCWTDAIRITGLAVSGAAGSARDCGWNQFANRSKASSAVPTQAMYRPIGIAISARGPDESKRCKS